MEWFGIGFALFFPTMLIVVSYLLVRIAWSTRRTSQALEQTNQKLERVVAELRLLRQRQLPETPAETAAVAPKTLAPAENLVVAPQVAVPAALPKAEAPQPVVEQKPKAAPPTAPPAEVFAPDVKCYYCGRSKPLARYLGQPICATCKQNALLMDEPAKR